MSSSSLSPSSMGFEKDEKELGTGIPYSSDINPTQLHAQDNINRADIEANDDRGSRAASAEIDPDNPKLKSWLQVAYAHLIVFNCWGFFLSYGAFQAYFQTTLNTSPSNIAWIGSLQVFLLFSVGMFSGRALDAGYLKHVIFGGLAFQLLGVFTMSVSTKLWQLILSGGVAVGIGNGLVFTPTVALNSTYFNRHRAIAIAIAASGGGVGGLVFPAIVRSLLPKIGYGWTVRVCGFIILVVGIVAGLGLKTRIPPRRSGPLLELAAFKETPYLLVCISAFLIYFGVFFGFNFISSYARDIVGMSYDDAASLLMVANAVGVPSRVIMSGVADRIGHKGPIYMFIVVLTVVSILSYAWVGVHSKAGIWVFTVLYGGFGASVLALFPAVMSRQTTDPSKQGTRIGMGFAIAGVGACIGTPVGGALISAKNGQYLYAQVWSASVILLGAMVILAIDFVKKLSVRKNVQR